MGDKQIRLQVRTVLSLIAQLINMVSLKQPWDVFWNESTIFLGWPIKRNVRLEARGREVFGTIADEMTQWQPFIFLFVYIILVYTIYQVK